MFTIRLYTVRKIVEFTKRLIQRDTRVNNAKEIHQSCNQSSWKVAIISRERKARDKGSIILLLLFVWQGLVDSLVENGKRIGYIREFVIIFLEEHRAVDSWRLHGWTSKKGDARLHGLVHLLLHRDHQQRFVLHLDLQWRTGGIIFVMKSLTQLQ